MARPSRNHDQGFRFQLSFGKDYHWTGKEEAWGVVLEAAESMFDRYSIKVRSNLAVVVGLWSR